MPKPSPHPAQPDPTLDDLIAQFDALSLEDQTAFVLRRCGALVRALQHVPEVKELAKTQSALIDTRAKPLHILSGGPYEQKIAMLDGRRISNGDILEVLVGVPEGWLAVWVDGLPEQFSAYLVTPYEVSRIELHERSYLRWPRKSYPPLERLVGRLRAEGLFDRTRQRMA